MHTNSGNLLDLNDSDHTPRTKHKPPEKTISFNLMAINTRADNEKIKSLKIECFGLSHS